MEDKYLDFEKEIFLLAEKITSLKEISEVDLSDQISKLEKKKLQLIEKTYAKLTPWQTVKLARHFERPQTLDYIRVVFDEFIELHGDREFGDDPAIITGIGKINGTSVVFVGQQKGGDTADRMKHNFGMPQPEGYRKALRVMNMAARFHMPIITFIDTPGAYPGMEAEERNQSIAIAENLMYMSDLKAPIISVVIGEGGSGGALAIGVSDRLLMLQYSVYSIISPEGCAAILWKDGSKADKAAEILKMTAKDLQALGIADRIIEEPLGGAHTDKIIAGYNLRKALVEEINHLNIQNKASIKNNMKSILAARSKKLEFINYVNDTTSISLKKKK